MKHGSKCMDRGIWTDMKTIKKDLQPNDVFERLRGGIDSFSGQQKALCTYLIDHYQQASFYTIEDLARASGTSPATVVRTVRRLGYASYKELLEHLQNILKNTTNSVWWELEQTINSSSDSDNEPTLSWVSRDTIDGIKHSLTRELMDSFDEAINLMLKARKIGFIGMRSSAYVAGYLHFLMNQVFFNTCNLTALGADLVYDEILNFNKSDLVIAVSLGGPHFVSTTHNVLKLIKTMDIPSVLITDDKRNPATIDATISLCVNKTSYHYSIIQAISVAEAIFTELMIKKKKTVRRKFKNLETVLIDYGVTLP